MSKRPGLLDLRSESYLSTASTNSNRPMRSPRLHVAGEAPPELSPLDAFAMQSRLLARQLQEGNRDGNRISRLPPLTVESPLVLQGRSDYFRSMSHGSESDPNSPENGTAGQVARNEVEVEEAFEAKNRPTSMHPRMSRIPPTPDEPLPAMPRPSLDALRSRHKEPIEEEKTSFFGVRRERSPSPMHSDTQSQTDMTRGRSPARNEGEEPLASSLPNQVVTASPGKSKQLSFDEAGLIPPKSLFPKRSSSILPSSPSTTEEEASTNVTGSLQSLPRKLSSGSTALVNPVPSPAVGSFHRSPSVASESSALPRPSFNFSRPISRAGTPSFDLPSRQASSDSQPSFVFADESAHTPVSMHSEAFMDQQAEDGKNTSGSYIYSKFILPRGKSIQRLEAMENPSQSSRWEQPMPPGAGYRYPAGAPPSPPTRPSSSSARTIPDDGTSMHSAQSMPRPSLDASKLSIDSARQGQWGYPSPNTSRPSNDITRRSEDIPRGRPFASHSQEPSARGRTPASTTTSDSASTIRAPTITRPAPAVTPASDISSEDHLAKGIACHEQGSLKESTYHLRLAARQNNPTAMLLYALACRHGWGMRANQREGVEWLRKAAEYASVEIADDQDQAKDGGRLNILESKAHKAQFALSVYELGVSHMNGWGIEQDKSLALRCFEIAGTWGDVDALAETGFCYAQGIGCKKNLKKSAKFYRMAEAKGMSMVGNSWIHKSKYADDEKTSPQKDKKKARSKSRTRTMFGLKSH